MPHYSFHTLCYAIYGESKICGASHVIWSVRSIILGAFWRNGYVKFDMRQCIHKKDLLIFFRLSLFLYKLACFAQFAFEVKQLRHMRPRSLLRMTAFHHHMPLHVCCCHGPASCVTGLPLVLTQGCVSWYDERTFGRNPSSSPRRNLPICDGYRGIF